MIRTAITWGTIVLAMTSVVGCSQKVIQDTEDKPKGKSGAQVAAAKSDENSGSSPQQQSETPKASDDNKAPANEQLRDLFERLDKLGRSKVKDAKFVELEFSSSEESAGTWSVKAWLVSRDDESIVVMMDDLIPRTYRENSSTTVPSSWRPGSVRLKSIKDADFEKLCQELSKPDDQPGNDVDRARRSFLAPGPSHRLLIAHAAWKQGLMDYCEPIVSADEKYKTNFAEYQEAVLEDLAWLHFLRGVNLLMFADRKEVLPHLRLVADLSPKGKFAAQSKDLVDHLETLVADENKPKTIVDESKLSDEEKAELYVSLIRDLRCPQMAQPGFIMPYMAIVDGKPDQNPPTLRLKQLGMSAVPALIKALEDDTPTRTVYHWREFSRSRRVWRVPDFAWNILREITKKEFGYRRVVGFTLGSMKPEEKRLVIEEIKQWRAANKELSPDDRMFGFFSSRDPEDWITAGKFFLKKKDKRAVQPLIEKVPLARSFTKGDLCELVAKFGDPSAKKVIQQVMETASDHSDRLSAAIALWTLGDNSGIPIVINYVKAKDQPYGSWDEPVWFLMRTKSKDSMDALKVVVTESLPNRAGGVIGFITASITGDLYGERREAAGCVEICPVLIAAMGRADYTGGSINGIKICIKDSAAKAFVLLREGTDDPFSGRFVEVDPKLFNELEPDEGKRDAQIKSLNDWYEKNKSKLSWDSRKNRLAVKK